MPVKAQADQEPIVEWVKIIFVAKPPRLFCTRCGSVKAYEQAPTLKKIALDVDIFNNIHKGCPEKLVNNDPPPRFT